MCSPTDMECVNYPLIAFFIFLIFLILYLSRNPQFFEPIINKHLTIITKWANIHNRAGKWFSSPWGMIITLILLVIIWRWSICPFPKDGYPTNSDHFLLHSEIEIDSTPEDVLAKIGSPDFKIVTRNIPKWHYFYYTTYRGYRCGRYPWARHYRVVYFKDGYMDKVIDKRIRINHDRNGVLTSYVGAKEFSSSEKNALMKLGLEDN